MARPAASLRIFSSALMALALILSAAAWGAHSATHGPALASVESVHARPAATAPGPPKALPDGDSQDGGHDHQLSLFFPVAALFGETPLDPPLAVAAATPAAEVATLALRPGDPPPADPPRLA